MSEVVLWFLIFTTKASVTQFSYPFASEESCKNMAREYSRLNSLSSSNTRYATTDCIRAKVLMPSRTEEVRIIKPIL